MKLGRIICVGLICLGFAVFSAIFAAAAIATATVEATATSFKLHGSHGYSISVFPFLTRDGAGEVELIARQRNAAVSYRAPASVSEDALHVEFGSIARIDVTRVPSGRHKVAYPKCVGGRWSYEPATYEGIIEFNGEGGYTRASASRVTALPLWLLFSARGFCNGGGYGEATGPGQPGARLRGTSLAHGRSLSFQVNKNNPRAKVFFTASLKERRDGVRIDRSLRGVAPSSAFSFDPHLQAATLSPPAPFSGSASMSRSEDFFSPLWKGGLRLAFPGRTVPLAGPGVYVSIAHARFTRSSSSEVEI